MPSRRISAAQAVARIHVTNVDIDGVWMPYEYLTDRAGNINVVMLADIEFNESARNAVWHTTLAAAAFDRYQTIEPCRKLAVRSIKDDHAVEERPFQQFLKRDLPALSLKRDTPLSA